jgi:hypothetical protein
MESEQPRIAEGLHDSVDVPDADEAAVIVLRPFVDRTRGSAERRHAYREPQHVVSIGFGHQGDRSILVERQARKAFRAPKAFLNTASPRPQILALA